MPKKYLSGILAFAASLSSVWGGVGFPNENGSWDISDPEAWGSAWPLTSYARLDDAGTYNAKKQDVSFTGLWPNAVGVVVDLTATSSRKITLTAAKNIMYPYSSGATLELKGGTWDFSGAAHQMGNVSNTKFTLSGGVKILNSGTFVGRTSGTGDHALTITGSGTSISATGFQSNYKYATDYPCDGSTDHTGVVVDMNGGSAMTLGGGNFQNLGGWMLVRGAGTTINGTMKNAYIGSGDCTGASGLHITDSATMSVTGTGYFILQNSSENCRATVLIDKNGSLSVESQLSIGTWGTSHHDNYFVVGKSGTLTAGSIYAGNTNNWFICRGVATLTGQSLFDLASTNCNSGIRIEGTAGRLIVGTAFKCTNAHVIFRFPAAAFSSTAARITAASTSISGDTTFEIENLPAYLAAIKTSGEVTLLELTSGTLPALTTQIEALNKKISAYSESKVYLSTDKKKLILKAEKASTRTVIWTGDGDWYEKPWTDTNNWTTSSGVLTTPIPGDKVQFRSGAPDLHVRDEDADLASAMYNYQLYNGGRVFWDVTTDSYLYAYLTGHDGMFYKTQDSTLSFEQPYTSQFDLGGAYTVVAGKLRLMHYADDEYYGNTPGPALFVSGYCTVSNGATLVIAEQKPATETTTEFYRLESYGLITNETLRSHVLGVRSDANSPANPSAIYGPIGGNITFGSSGCCDIYSENNTYPTFNPRCNSGGGEVNQLTIGLGKFGLSDGSTSSAGVQNRMRYTWSGALFKYLGTGETTDKTFEYQLHSYYTSWKYNHIPGLDGGPYGGLVYNGLFQTTGGYHTHLLFTGTNAAPCVVGGGFYQWTTKNGIRYSTYIHKRGSGTWYFTDGTGKKWSQSNTKVGSYGGLTGGLSIEEGTLQFESLADQDEFSSVGAMCDLYGEYFGAHDETKRVEWAISFGTDDAGGTPLTEGTFESISTNIAFACNRKMVLRGNGRLKSSGTDAFCLSHVSTRTLGHKTLTLDGENTLDNVLQEVEDGVGKITVAKEGSGKWILRGNQTFSGDLLVKAGLLEVEAPTNLYTWYRFSDLRDPSSIFQPAELALYDADGNQQNVGLAFAGTEDGAEHWIDNEWTRIEPGQCYYGRRCWATCYGGGNAMSRIFDGKADNGCAYGGMPAPADDLLTRNTIVMRVKKGTPAIVAYDICRGSIAGRNTQHFRLEGSRDGLNWVNLHEWDSGADSSSDTGTWYSDDQPFVNGEKRSLADNKGFEIADGSQDAVSSLQHVRRVRVDPGATLRTTYSNVGRIGQIELSGEGSGTFDGFEFTEEGTLDIVSEEAPLPGLIPMKFANSTTVDNLRNWRVTLNGRLDSRCNCKVGPKGVTVSKRAFVIIFD